MITLTPINDRASLRASWGWVRQGLLAVAERVQARWIPEDVYMALASAKAALYIIATEGDELGFLVIELNTGIDGEREMHIWTIWGEAMMPFNVEIQSQVDALARSVQACRITCDGREGWARDGYMTPIGRRYEREL